LQQIAVVAGDFDDLVTLIEAETRDRHLDIGLGMSQPRIGVGREVGVIAVNVFRLFNFFYLHQKTVRADVGMERVKRFHLFLTRRFHVALAQGRRSQVDKGVL
jgi:hypothetical protein